MEKQLIISIGREFGSGGHVIAEALAKKFNIPMYDHNLLDCRYSSWAADPGNSHSHASAPCDFRRSARLFPPLAAASSGPKPAWGHCPQTPFAPRGSLNQSASSAKALLFKRLRRNWMGAQRPMGKRKRPRLPFIWFIIIFICFFDSSNWRMS